MREVAGQAGDSLALVAAARPVRCAARCHGIPGRRALGGGGAARALPMLPHTSAVQQMARRGRPDHADHSRRRRALTAFAAQRLYSTRWCTSSTAVLLAVAFAFSAPFYLWKGRGTGKYLRTLRERMGRLPADRRPAAAGRRSGSTPSRWARCWPRGRWSSALKDALPGPPHLRLHDHRSPDRPSRARASRGADGLFFAPFDFPRPVRRALDARATRAARAGGDRDLAEPHPRGAAAAARAWRWSTAASRRARSRATGGCARCCAACWPRSTSS